MINDDANQLNWQIWNVFTVQYKSHQIINIYITDVSISVNIRILLCNIRKYQHICKELVCCNAVPNIYNTIQIDVTIIQTFFINGSRSRSRCRCSGSWLCSWSGSRWQL